MQVKCYITAGGKSTRFGSDKSLHPWNGKPLISAVHDIASKIIPDITVITNDPGKYSFLKARTIPDIVKGIGPIGGLQSALHDASGSTVLFLGCDMPSIRTELISYMLTFAAEHDVVIPCISGFYEPLCAFYSPACLEPVERLIEIKQFQIFRFFGSVKVRTINEKEVNGIGIETGEIFRNINYRHEIE